MTGLSATLPDPSARQLALARPVGRPVGFQRWRDLLFLHWPVAPDLVQATLPAGLQVDTFDGQAWIGVVAFAMRDVVPSWSPSLPGVSNFLELNVRTYVHRDGRDPGVYFFSLDAAGSLAVSVGRARWRMPYHRARMHTTPTVLDGAPAGTPVRYRSQRLWPGPRPADLDVSYRVGDPLPAARPESLEFFLAERYLLHLARRGRIYTAAVHHRPYPLYSADLMHVDQSMTGDLPITADPHLLFSPGVDVDIYPLRHSD